MQHYCAKVMSESLFPNKRVRARLRCIEMLSTSVLFTLTLHSYISDCVRERKEKRNEVQKIKKLIKMAVS